LPLGKNGKKLLVAVAEPLGKEVERS